MIDWKVKFGVSLWLKHEHYTQHMANEAYTDGTNLHDIYTQLI